MPPEEDSCRTTSKHRTGLLDLLRKLKKKEIDGDAEDDLLMDMEKMILLQDGILEQKVQLSRSLQVLILLEHSSFRIKQKTMI